MRAGKAARTGGRWLAPLAASAPPLLPVKGRLAEREVDAVVGAALPGAKGVAAADVVFGACHPVAEVGDQHG